MSDDPRETQDLAIGTPVIAADGTLLGEIRESYPHYLLVGQEGGHDDLEVPVQAIVGMIEGKLQVSVDRDSVTAVDDVETAHRQTEQGA